MKIEYLWYSIYFKLTFVIKKTISGFIAVQNKLKIKYCL
ncbi:hypothetical protein D1BOALGB6SA_2164 [Olavius sp. associated proteobacterium Delta 1]|nr:hypothetical protein D1BOALGB6SA_2164 [Olavius sp. associated proteobacterium Delta 1]